MEVKVKQCNKQKQKKKIEIQINVKSFWMKEFSILKLWFSVCSEAATVDFLWKKVILEISQNSQENTCARVSFTKILYGGKW